MKAVITILIILFISPFSMAASCLTSSEDYATEVVVSDYNLFNLRKFADFEGGKYIMESQYDQDLFVLIDEVNFPQGISIRIQMPTKSEEIVQPNLKLLSTSFNGLPRENLASSFQRWNINCDDSSCEFSKDDVVIEASDSNVLIEFSEGLNDCSESCSGICFSTPSASKCLEKTKEDQISNVLRVSNVSVDFESLLDSYRVVGSEEIILTDIVPLDNKYVDWQEAMRQELVFLSNNKVIELEREEIEEIVVLSKRGQAGQNYRIAFDYNNNEWNYYNEIEGSILTSQRDCSVYQHLSAPVGIIDSQEKVFYLVPLIIGFAGILLIVFLVLIAKVVTRNGKAKN